jgi:CRP-like cAMP-binding protein
MDVIQELKKVFLFSEVPDSALKLLAESAEEMTFQTGQKIASEHDAGDTLYLVRNGSVRLSKDGEATPLVLGPGGSFGQMAILDGGKVGVDAIAVERVDLLAIRAANLSDNLANDHEAAHHLFRAVSKSLAKRLRHAVDSVALAREGLSARKN